MKSWILAGCGGLVVAVAHGFLGATQVIPPITGVPEATKAVLHGIFFLSAVYWAVGALALIWFAGKLGSPIRAFVGWTVAAMFASGAVANAWATSGQHFGWMMLAVLTGLILFGLRAPMPR